MLVRLRAVPALLSVLFMLAIPATASAAIYSVNSTGDQPDESLNGTCKTAVNTCTLRAAIEESNKSEGVLDAIEFAANFNGENADTITAASDLPTITDRVNILGGRCETEAAGAKGPCAGVFRSGGGSLFVVDADEVKIEGLAITGATNGINVINGSDGFIAKNDWVGLNLKGEAAANGTGILIGRGADGASIGGGVEESERNVIAGNTFVGLDLEGASGATIRGNYFGVAPDGTTPRAQVKDIELTDSTFPTTVKAVENEIGEAINEANRATAKCDGGCNVIGGASVSGVDLNGDKAETQEAPATGPTVIHGNYIGVSASGTGTVANGGYGVLAGAADDVQVGGLTEGETNYFAGSSEAIATEEGESFIVRRNTFGIGPSGAELTRPGKAVFALDQGVAVPPTIELNLIFAGSIGIEQRGGVGHLTGNEVIGGSIGIYAKGEPGGGLIASNFISAASENGILVEGPGNEVRANSVLESGAAGIRFRNPPGIAMTGGLIGGSTSEKENLIQGSGGPAIEIVEEALEVGSETEIARNHGSGNKGLFIDLVSGANEGILPPALSAAKQTGAEGTAEPGATVRVFRKASAETGELAGFLGEAEANGSGSWKVSFGSVPAGTLITATQTNGNGATSELAQSLAAAAEPSGGGGGGNNGGGGGKGGNKDTTPPDTKITKGPPKKTHKTTAKFKFTSSEAGSTFECKLDKGKFKKCGSPKTYKKLKPGKHVFKVRAIDKAHNVDPTPAKRKFTILR
jgi:hypothetical protein